MISTYPTEHVGRTFESAPTRRQTVRRNRVAALAVIAAVAASAGLLQHFNDNLAPGGPASPDAGGYFAAR